MRINGEMTWPRDAAATGCGEISEKIWSSGDPSSFSIVLNATSVENGEIRSCNNESSLRYDGGIRSYKEFTTQNMNSRLKKKV